MIYVHKFDEDNDVIFHVDPVLKNWFPVMVPRDSFDSFRPRDQALVERLKPDVLEWLKENIRLPWHAHFTSSYLGIKGPTGDGHINSPFCVIFFRTKTDAALFKMFWND